MYMHIASIQLVHDFLLGMCDRVCRIHTSTAYHFDGKLFLKNNVCLFVCLESRRKIKLVLSSKVQRAPN